MLSKFLVADTEVGTNSTKNLGGLGDPKHCFTYDELVPTKRGTLGTRK